MEISAGYAGDAERFAGLFADSFAACEGPDEGTLIGSLVRDILARTDPGDLYCFVARDGETLIGAVCFTRLRYVSTPRLSAFADGSRPDAATQGRRAESDPSCPRGAFSGGFEAVLTYGDPAYYGRVGFAPIVEAAIAAPYPLTIPQGWLGQSLTPTPLGTFAGRPHCVAAFQRPEIW
ncbi:GNAT family N-acetyltransferase [Thioclava sp. NG1]|nr:GNAT family N-acetyltransferase [Thioclava sp. NG1]